MSDFIFSLNATVPIFLIMVLGCFAGCSGDSYKEDTVMVVNGTEVSFDEYCYWLGYSASYLQYVYSSYTGSSAVDWDAASPLDENQTNFEWCVANTKETIVKSCIVEAEFNDRGLKLSDEDKRRSTKPSKPPPRIGAVRAPTRKSSVSTLRAST